MFATLFHIDEPFCALIQKTNITGSLHR